MPNIPPGKKQRQFARSLSGVIARRMRQNGLENVYQLMRLIPEYAQVPTMSVYSAVYGRGRPSAWIIHWIADALETTGDKLIKDAIGYIDAPLPSVREMFGEANRRGRPSKDGKRK